MILLNSSHRTVHLTGFSTICWFSPIVANRFLYYEVGAFWIDHHSLEK
uniref:Uncharacterized protein n=1 Tax=Anguilla anguilla TaxID=7936 RepID=A0A0E9PS07_ANGAN